MAINVLITGASGFVGQSLIRHYNDRTDIRLFGHGRDSAALRKTFENNNITILDDYRARQLDEFAIDSIVHTAGIAHDLSNQYQASDYFQVNTEGTKAAYLAFQRSKAKQFIFLSSIKAAVDSFPGLITEEIVPAPGTPYGQSKLQAERFIEAQRTLADKQSFVLRPCMIHGSGNKGNLNLLYKFVSTGIPFPLGAFKNQRSFLSIDNFCFVIDEILKGVVPSGTYNLSDNGFLSTTGLYELIARETGKKARVLKLPAKIITGVATIAGKKKMLAKLTDNMLVSNDKIRQHVPKSLAISLEQGLIKTIQSFRSE